MFGTFVRLGEPGRLLQPPFLGAGPVVVTANAQLLAALSWPQLTPDGAARRASPLAPRATAAVELGAGHRLSRPTVQATGPADGDRRGNLPGHGTAARSARLPDWVAEIDAALGVQRAFGSAGSQAALLPGNRPSAAQLAAQRLGGSPASPRRGPAAGGDRSQDRQEAGLRFVPARLGLRVRRGPDWRWEDQDGGPGGVGRLLGAAGPGWVVVRWDGGHENGYRVGEGGAFDLQAAEGGPPAVVSALPQPSTAHLAAALPRLEAADEERLRRRLERPDHLPQQERQRHELPLHRQQQSARHQLEQQPPALQKWRRHEQHRSPHWGQQPGTVPQWLAREGARVERGPDWKWDNQDGGVGSVGVIVGEARAGWVSVRWPSGTVNGYRVGDGGRYDLRLAGSAAGLVPAAHGLVPAAHGGCQVGQRPSSVPRRRCRCIDQFGDVLELPT